MNKSEITQYAKQFWQNGFIVIDDFFDGDIISLYNEKIIEHFGMNPEFEHTDEFIEKSAVEVIPWFPQREGVECFDIVSEHKILNALTTAILGEHWLCPDHINKGYYRPLVKIMTKVRR